MLTFVLYYKLLFYNLFYLLLFSFCYLLHVAEYIYRVITFYYDFECLIVVMIVAIICCHRYVLC